MLLAESWDRKWGYLVFLFLGVGTAFFDFLTYPACAVGICLGLALKKALGDRAGIRRFGSCYVPMDEALTFTALDFSNRPYLVFDAPMPQERIGEYDSCLTVEFMRALAMNAGITLHQKCFYGANAHHITEGLFKSLGMAVRDAVKVEGSGVVSTKGVL